MEEETKIYPELLQEALRKADIPQEEVEATIDLLTYSFIAHL